MVLPPIIFSIMLFSFRKVRGVLCSNQCDFLNKLTKLSDATELLCMLIRRVNGITWQTALSVVVHSKRLISQYLPSATYTLSNINSSILLIGFCSLLFCINIWKQNVSLHLLVIMMMKLWYHPRSKSKVSEHHALFQCSYTMLISIFYCAQLLFFQASCPLSFSQWPIH